MTAETATHSSPPLAPDTDVGALQVPHLKRCWSRWMAARRGRISQATPAEAHRTRIVLSALGVGLEQTLQYVLNQAPDFARFEDWIVRTAGAPTATTVARIQALVAGNGAVPDEIALLHAQVDAMAPVLSAQDLDQWHTLGYVIVRSAVPPQDSAAAAQVVWNAVQADPADPRSWYAHSPRNTMVQLFQHPAFDANRRSLRIHKAFAQLWGTADLWRSTDRCGFNPPERPGYPYSGQGLHWDVSLHQPIPLGTQGILYLTDTPPEQGALHLVPGFQHRVGDWLAQLPEGANPRTQDLRTLKPVPIGAGAGDLIIWHQALPHGPSPNTGNRPRLVQYINLTPGEVACHTTWL